MTKPNKADRQAARHEARKLTLAQRPAFPKLEVNNVRTGFVAEAELRALVAELDERVGPLVEFMYATGWRKSEALGLTWDRVDEDGRVVRLDVGTTKNKGRPQVPVHARPGDTAEKSAPLH